MKYHILNLSFGYFFDSYCHSLAGFEKKAASSDLKISSIKGLNLQNLLARLKPI
jgi:hypothetical protein